LDRLWQLLTENPGLKIEISGHTDNIGKAEDNQVLANNRAKAIADYLVNKGIPQSRISYKGYGATQPIADNQTEAGRAQNR
ncbi:OmpA family protein, partial [Escherichia fergusonii]|uniref:OmpA family protein n=1 Tax=Escherichia fergusonii TaxID=564 RepID=UPI001CBE42D1